MKINQLKAGVVLSYGTQGIHILTGLLYTPLMLRLLGQSEYGLYQLVYSVVSYLSLLSLGFGSSYIRFYSRYRAENNEDGVARLNGMFMTIFTIIALICILSGVVMIKNSRSIFGDGLTAAELGKARILLWIMVFNMAANFINSVFSSIITAHEQFFFQKLVHFLKELFNPFLTLPLLIMGYGSVAMVAVTTFLTVTMLVTDIIFCIKKLGTRFCFHGFQYSLFKEMWAFTFFIFINMIVDQLNWSIDKLLLGRMIGVGAVAIYGVAAQLNTLYIALSAAVSGVFIPRVNLFVAEKRESGLISELFTKVGRIQFLLLGLILSGYIIFGREFISVWAGKGYEDAYVIGLFLMVPGTVPLLQNLGIEVQRAKNMHQIRSIVYMLVAISNIFVSIACIMRWGTSGAAVGTAISMTAGNILFMNFYYHKKMDIDMLCFWRQILRLFVPAAFATAAGIFALRLIPVKGSVTTLVLMILLYSVLYVAIMWIFGMNKREKDLVSGPLKKLGEKLWKR